MTELSKPNGRPRRNYYEIFEQALTEARYQRIVERVMDKAEVGDLKAARLVIEHAQGKPVQRHEVVTAQDTNLERIQRLLAEAGQPVQWSVNDADETISSFSDNPLTDVTVDLADDWDQ